MGARIRARLAREEGQTFIEMLTVMAMLSFVMAAVATVFVAGLHAQTDMDQRFQAQQNARLALEHPARHPHLVRGPAGVLELLVEHALASGVSGAKVVFASACDSSATGVRRRLNVTWCADSSSGAAARSGSTGRARTT